MIYAQYNDLIIRDMTEKDVDAIHEGNISQGWHSERNVYAEYYDKQQKHEHFVFVAEYMGEYAGYTTLRPCAVTGPFSAKGFPEVVDLNVLEKFQRRGIGSRILGTVEKFALGFSDTITLAVGLHSGYGAAQRLYVARGYVPDGSGVWYGDSVLEQYAPCRNDDDLVMYMSKKLK